MLNLMFIALLGYLTGSFPTSLIFGKVFRKGLDIRQHGSGNMGATNSFRVLGWRIGLAVAFLDMFKGFAAAYWITRVQLGGPVFPEQILFIASTLSVVLGHVFPLFAGFRGGKGFGAAVGAVTSYAPLSAPFCLLIFFITLGFTGYVSVCALTAALTLPLSYGLIQVFRGEAVDPVILGFFILIVFIVALAVKKRIRLFIKGEAEVFERAKIFIRRKE